MSIEHIDACIHEMREVIGDEYMDSTARRRLTTALTALTEALRVMRAEAAEWQCRTRGFKGAWTNIPRANYEEHCNDPLWLAEFEYRALYIAAPPAGETAQEKEPTHE